jgi:CBS domain containing-hemolysin-like protein
MELAAIGLALALVLANGFFVAVEFALVKVRPTQLEALVEQGHPGAAQALAMRRHLDVWLSASQVGITLASLALGWVGEPAFSALIEPVLLRAFPDSETARAVAHTAGVVVAFALITFLHIVVGEQVPKTLAIAEAERTAMALAWPMRLFHGLLRPVIWVLNAGTHGVLRLLGLDHVHAETDELGEEELKLILSASAESGALDQAQAELLARALSMMEKSARQVMVPRSQLQALDLEESLEENLASASASGHTWLPVVRGSIDRVEGLINVKDLYLLQTRGELRSVGQVQRPVLFVPENVTLDKLLLEFRRRKGQVAIVVDEHGGTSGIVTLADVVAELVGDVAQLGRKVEPTRTLPGGRLELPGTAQLDDLEHTLEVEFDVDRSEITTIAGYLMARLGRVPKAGDAHVLGELRIVVVRTEGPRVATVRIEPRLGPPPNPPGRPTPG